MITFLRNPAFKIQDLSTLKLVVCAKNIVLGAVLAELFYLVTFECWE